MSTPRLPSRASLRSICPLPLYHLIMTHLTATREAPAAALNDEGREICSSAAPSFARAHATRPAHRSDHFLGHADARLNARPARERHESHGSLCRIASAGSVLFLIDSHNQALGSAGTQRKGVSECSSRSRRAEALQTAKGAHGLAREIREALARPGPAEVFAKRRAKPARPSPGGTAEDGKSSP